MALELDPGKTALVLIDLQKGVLSMPLQPHAANAVVDRGAALARAVAGGGGLVVAVNVAFAPDQGDRATGRTDAPAATGAPPAGFAELHPEVAALDAVVVTKRQWGAFHGTALDDLLRRRGIRNVVITGLATNFGVEQTAREAWQHDYSVVIADDACSSFSPEMHDFALTAVLPRIARIRSTAEVLEALEAA